MNRHLKTLGAIALAAGMVPAAAAQAQDDPIELGAIYILSGAASTYGEFAQDGADLAVERINDNGGVLGRELEITYEDSQIEADSAISAMRKLVYQDGVDLLMGLDSSGVATGVVPVVPEVQTPFVITHAATPDVTGKLCNAWTYRVSVNINQNLRGAAIRAAETGARTWTTVGPDYAFGHQSWEFFQQYLSEENADAEFSDQPSFPAFGTEDFTPFINTVMDQDPDGVFVSLWGGDLVNFVRQAHDLGFFEQDFEVVLSLGAATEVLDALGEQMPPGVHVGTRYWFDAPDNAENDAFVEAFKQRYGKMPSYNAQNAYAAVHAYKAAIEKAGSVDKAAVRDALSGLSFDAPIGEIHLRDGDHQGVVGPVYGTVADEMAGGIRTLENVRAFDGETVTPAVADTGCKLGG